MTPKTGLYIHVPFCQEPCGYCDFYKVKGARVDDGYVDGLLKEAWLYKEEPKTGLDTIYFGGGTPSLLEPAQLEKVFKALDDVFDLSGAVEISMEANPETLSEEKLRSLQGAGVNRLSIGIQSLEDRCLELLSRRARRAGILAALQLLEKIPFEHLSFDLILGAPGTDEKKIVENLETLLEKHFCHVSLYVLELHENTKLYAKVREGLEVPCDDKVTEAYEAVSDLLEARGFTHYEISNFARKGCECRHNLKYWRRDDYIGLGPSAHGRFRGSAARNPRSTAEWLRRLEGGSLPWEDVYRETAVETLENRMIFGLRLKEGVEVETLQKYGAEGGAGLDERLAKLKENGLAEISGGRMRLTRQGFLLSSEVTAYLLSDKYRSSYEGAEDDKDR